MIAEETSSLLVPGVDTPTTKFKVNDKSVTVKSFTAPAGPEGPPCSTDPYPARSQVICSSVSHPPKQIEEHSQNLDAYPEVVQVHPPPEPTACSEQTTNRVNETTVNKEARPVPSSTAAVNISSQSSTDLHQNLKEEESVVHESGASASNTEKKKGPQSEVKTGIQRKGKCEEDSASRESNPETLSARIDIANGDHEWELVDVNECPREDIPLLPGNTNQRAKTKRKKWLMRNLCGILGFLIATILFMGVFSALYESRLFVNVADSSNHSVTAVLGDYVLFHCQMASDLMYHYKLSVSVLPKGSLHPVNIYGFSHAGLLEKTLQKKFFGGSSSNTPSLIPLVEKIYFDHCSLYNGKCILDQYLFQAKSPTSEINYLVTLDNFTAGETNVQIIVFDDHKYFMNFLNGGGISGAIDRARVDNKTYLFVFDDDQMRESSYYFIAIEDIEGSSEWFTVKRFGLHVYYNASAYPPLCVVNSSNSYSCEVEVTDNYQCFLSQVRGGRVKAVPNDENLFKIVYYVSDPKPTNAGWGIVFGGSFGFVSFVSLLCWVVCKMFLRLRKGCKPDR